MSRLREAFDACATRHEAALVGYLMAGDPTPATCRPAFEAVLDEVDVLEIGIPFSDPVADGPTIERAGLRARTAGTTLDDVFALLRHLRARSAKPIALMTYANPPYRRGWTAFAREARDAGADAVLLPDVPLEESGEPGRALAEAGLDLVQLASPATGPARMAALAAASSGFLYLVSSFGTTGARDSFDDRTRRLVGEARKAAGSLPVAVGFGVSTPEQVRSLVEAGASGVVVGSALVALVEKGAPPDAIAGFARGLKSATRL